MYIINPQRGQNTLSCDHGIFTKFDYILSLKEYMSELIEQKRMKTN